jgi:hypothetical protein
MMKVVRWLTATAGIAFVLSVQAPDRALGAVGDAETILYRFPGVTDDGGGVRTGVATSFHCTNFSGVTETVRIVVRNENDALVANLAINISHLRTRTYTTHSVVLYGGAIAVLNTGQILQGSAAIAATSTSVVCTAMTIDAASASPVGIKLHGIRFSPVPGTQE